MRYPKQFKWFLFGLSLWVLGSSPIWAVIEAQPGAVLENDTELFRCGISPDGSYAAVGSDTTEVVRIYESATGTLTGKAPVPEGTEDLELSNSGERIFVGSQNGGVYCFNRSGAQLWKRSDIDGEVSVGATAVGNIVFTVGTPYIVGKGKFYRLNGANGDDLIVPVTIPVESGQWVWGVDASADGSRVLLRTNSDIFIMNGFGVQTHFYDIVTGHYLEKANLSPDGRYFVVTYRDPVASMYKVALYEIGVGEKWSKQITFLAGVGMDDHNWVYVSNIYGDTVLYNNAGSEITRWNDGGRYFDVAHDGSRCIVGEYSSTDRSTTVYDFVDSYECYLDLHMQAYITDVVPYDADTKRYTLTIANWYDVPPDLFVPSPELPACGLNDQAGRSYIRIKGNEGALYFNGCGAGDGITSEILKNLTFLVDDTEPLDPYIYLELWDRKCDQYLHSIYAYARKPCPVGDLDGDCIVNLRDFTLMAENWLINHNP